MKTEKTRKQPTKTGVLAHPRRRERHVTEPRVAVAPCQQAGSEPSVTTSFDTAVNVTGTVSTTVYKDKETAKLVREAVESVKTFNAHLTDVNVITGAFKVVKEQILALNKRPKCGYLVMAIEGMGYSMSLSVIKAMILSSCSHDTRVIPSSLLENAMEVNERWRSDFLVAKAKLQTHDEQILRLPELDGAASLEEVARDVIAVKRKVEADQK